MLAVSSGGLHSSGNGRSPSGSGGLENFMPPRSVEDQMARELADAESAIDDIFGDEQQTTKGLGGMSMIEQLEKKARKDSNKKLVENRDEVNCAIAELLAKKLSTDEEAIKYYSEICPKLEGLGLSLGSDAVQTWSARCVAWLCSMHTCLHVFSSNIFLFCVQIADQEQGDPGLVFLGARAPGRWQGVQSLVVAVVP